MDHDLTRIIQGGVEFSELHAQHYAYQLLCGVKYIHSADVIHRDLKPGNILVNVHGELKICDFGLARGIAEEYQSADTKLTKYVATRWYRAPELIISNRHYTTASKYESVL
jgi:mitogen-activated protein kinase